MPLHVTNGSSAVDRIRAAGIEGDFLSWDDVLHEGPIPGDAGHEALREARARFIASCGWAALDDVRGALAARDDALDAARGGDEIVLWFEHDLYDQLQLVQVLDRLASAPMRARLTLALADDYLGHAAPATIRALHAGRADATAATLDAARRAWSAVRASDPTALAEVADDPAIGVLPHLAPALRRLLDELPDVRAGLSRSERQALEAIAAGHDTPAAAYRASHHDREPAIFLGDSTFATHLERLSACAVPLVRFADGGGVVRAPRGDARGDADGAGDGAGYWARRLELTHEGRAVLAGAADHVALNGAERWVGGARVGGDAPWRSDGRRVVRRP